MSTPFLSKINAPADSKAVKITTERPFYNNSHSRSSANSIGISDGSSDQNDDDLHLVGHDHSYITKTFDNLNNGSHLQNGDPENLLD